MSGRSAYVRKKITDTKPGDRAGGRAKSSASSDDASVSDYAAVAPTFPPRHGRHAGPVADIIDIGPANTPTGLLPGFTEDEALGYGGEILGYQAQSGGSHSGSSLDGRRERLTSARTPRPLGRDDLSGIEKSGLRSVLDKKSDEVRKGLAKAFTFKKKGSKDDDAEKTAGFRPGSAATVRPAYPARGRFDERDDNYDPTPPQPHYQGAPHAVTTSQRDGAAVTMPLTNLQPTQPGAVSAMVKRWAGAGRPVQRWNKLRKDPELWDPNGDVLVFLGHKGQSSSLHPSFRLSSHLIEATGSRNLMTLLRQGALEEDVQIPASPAGAPPMLQRKGSYSQHLPVPRGGLGRGGQPTPPGSEDSSQWETDGQVSYEMYFPAPPGLPALDQLRHHLTTRNVFALLSHASLVGFTLHQALTDLQSRLDSYMPPEADTVGTLTGYLSARGLDDVRNDPETAVGLLAWSEGTDVRWEEGWRECFLHCAGMYPRVEACADFRHVTPVTRALLERAWLETQLRTQAAEERLAGFDYGDMWPAEVAIAASTSGPVVAAPAKAVMDRLRHFFVRYYAGEFGAWPPRPPPPPPVPSGPLEEGDGDTWLTRTVAQSLQKDFAALYDYLVDRDIVWRQQPPRAGSRSQRWTMASRRGRDDGSRPFEPDTPDLPMTDMLLDFDTRHGFPHIPHPYPLVPDSMPLHAVAGSGTSKSPTTPTTPVHAGRAAATLDRRIQLAYTESTNIYLLPPDSPAMQSRLVEAFTKFEKADHHHSYQPYSQQQQQQQHQQLHQQQQQYPLSPRNAPSPNNAAGLDASAARRARWVLIYGVLQTLASVAVDAPGARYRDGVGYFLSVSLAPRGGSHPRGKDASGGGAGGGRVAKVQLPPWEGAAGGGVSGGGGADLMQGRHDMSHCWVVPGTWLGGGDESNDDDDGGRGGGGNGDGDGDGDGDGYYPSGEMAMRSRRTNFSVPGPARRVSGNVPSWAPPPPSPLPPPPLTRARNRAAGAYAPPPDGSGRRPGAGSDAGRRSTLSTSSSAAEPHARGSRRGLPAQERAWAAPGSGRRWDGAGERNPHQHQHHRYAHELDAVLDDEVDVDGESFIVSLPYGEPAGRGEDGISGLRGTGGSSPATPGPEGSGAEAGGVGPLIRDFDELGVID